MSNDRIFYSAADCITRFNASKFPLKNVAQDVIKAKNLNSRERKIFLDVIFSWSRNRYLAKEFLIEKIPLFYAMSEQEKEMLGLSLITAAEFDWPHKLEASMPERYKEWLKKLGDERFLIALGPLLREHVHKSFANWQEIVPALWSKPEKYIAYDDQVDESQIIQVLNDLGLEVKHHDVLARALRIRGNLEIEKLPKSLRGHLWFMDAGSQIIAQLVRPKPGQRVLDMCVGEGSKARIISLHGCDYYAVDIDPRRLEKAKKVLSPKITFKCEDASKLSLPKNSFDWVLLDAPCSGSGVMRRNPDLVHRLEKKDLDNYVNLQKILLKNALEMLKSGGIVLYATCSLLSVENQQQIDLLMNKTKNLIPVSLKELLADGALKLTGLDLDKNTLTLLPNIHDCDAFFLAALKKS